MEESHLQKQISDLARLQDLATLAMQAMVIFDDLDDKLIDHPHLLDATGIKKEEVEQTSQLLRAMTDLTFAARNDAKQSLFETLARRDNDDELTGVQTEDKAPDTDEMGEKIYLDKREETKKGKEEELQDQ